MAMLRLVLCMLTATLAIKVPSNRIRTTKPTIAGRRDACSAFGIAALGLLPSQARAGDEEYKDLTTKVSSKLLTSAETAAASKDALATINWAAPKVTGLSTAEMAKRIDSGLRHECWFVTGRSLPELFSESFTFSDPQARCHLHLILP